MGVGGENDDTSGDDTDSETPVKCSVESQLWKAEKAFSLGEHFNDPEMLSHVGWFKKKKAKKNDYFNNSLERWWPNVEE